jgi:hypothetical protein
MPKPWLNSRVRLTYMELDDIWRVTDRDGTWCELSPENNPAEDLAKLSPTAKLWVRTRDITRLPNQQETLI